MRDQFNFQITSGAVATHNTSNRAARRNKSAHKTRPVRAVQPTGRLNESRRVTAAPRRSAY